MEILELIFIGTGPSSSLPNVLCLNLPQRNCKVCCSSITPEGRKNRRNNTSLLIRLLNDEGEQKNILIDCGKTFYSASLEWLYKYNILHIDAVILTHGHADAMMGLDDLRPWCIMASNPRGIPVYLSAETMGVVSRVFPYLVDTNQATGGGEVSSLMFNIFSPKHSFEVEGLEFIPLEVQHGFYGDNSPYMSLGFRFEDISYVSDVSHIPEPTKNKMLGSKLLIIDCLRREPYPSHFGLNQALEVCHRLRPTQTFFVGVSHSLDHYELTEELKSLKSEGLNVAPAYDGLRINVSSNK